MGRLFSALPITQKLLPTSRQNWIYLLEVAALTRLVTGGIRVWVERPSQQSDPRLSDNEKRQSMIERFFVEILGTLGYMAVLHLGQDFIDTLHAAYHKELPTIHVKQLPFANQQRLAQITHSLGWTIETLDHKINQMIHDVYQDPNHYPKGGASQKSSTRHMLYRVLYGDEMIFTINGETLKSHGKANLATMKKRFIQEFKHIPEFKNRQDELEKAFEAIVQEIKPLKAFALHNNRWASAAIALGVTLSALIGGNVIQTGNDRMVAPLSKVALNKIYPGGNNQTVLQENTPKNTSDSLNIVSAVPEWNIPPSMPPLGIAYMPNPKTQPNAGFAGFMPSYLQIPARHPYHSPWISGSSGTSGSLSSNGLIVS